MQQDHLHIIEETQDGQSEHDVYVATDTLLKIQEEQKNKLVRTQLAHRNYVEVFIQVSTQFADLDEQFNKEHLNHIQTLQLEAMHENQRLEQGYHMELQRQQEKHLIELQDLHNIFMRDIQQQQIDFIQQHREFKNRMMNNHQHQASTNTSSSSSGGAVLMAANTPRFNTPSQ